MRSLPALRFVLRERHKATVHIDYHVEFQKRFYSVHHAHVGKKIEVRATASFVEIFLGDDRIASHARSHGRPGTTVTCSEHRPTQHQHLVWPPERMIEWASTFGAAVSELVERTLAKFKHPEQGYRACLGIVRVATQYGPERADAACRLALGASTVAVPHRKHLESILRSGLDRKPPPAPTPQAVPLDHENVRGGDYYDRKEPLH